MRTVGSISACTTAQSGVGVTLFANRYDRATLTDSQADRGIHCPNVTNDASGRMKLISFSKCIFDLLRHMDVAIALYTRQYC